MPTTLSNGTISLALNSGTTTIVGSIDTITAASGVQVDVSGNSDVLNLANYDDALILSGNNDVVNVNAGTLSTGANVIDATVVGTYDTANLGSGNTLTVIGNYDVVNAGASNTVAINPGGVGDTIEMNAGTLVTAANVIDATVVGTYDTAYLGSGNTLTVVGNYDVVNAGSSNQIGISAGGYDDTINMTADTLFTAAGVTYATVVGTYDTAYLGSGNVFTVVGNYDVVNAGSSNQIGINPGGTGDTVNMTHGELSTGANVIHATVVGTYDTVNLGSGNTFTVVGGNDVVNAGSINAVGINPGGNNNTINMTGGVLGLSASLSGTVLMGSSNTLDAVTGDQVDINGSGNTANMANGDTISILGGSGNDIYLSAGVLNVSNNVLATLLDGTGDTVFGGAGDVFSVFGGSDELVLSGTSDTVGLLSNNNNVFVSNGVIETYNNVTGSLIDGTNDTINAGTLNSMSIFGGNDVISVAGTASLVALFSNANTVSMNGGTLTTYNNVTGTVLDGANNLIAPGTGNQIDINGSGNTAYMLNGDSVSIWGGTGNQINLNSGTLYLSAGVTGAVLAGNSNAIGGLIGDQLDISGNSNNATLGNGDTVSLWFGGGNVINVNDGILNISANVVSNSLLGSGDTVGALANTEVNIEGSNNTVNMGNASSVSLWAGVGNNVYMSSSTLNISANVVSNTLWGYGDTVIAQAGDEVNIDGSNDTVYMPSTGAVSIWAGTGNVVSMSGGTLEMSAGQVIVALDGSGDNVAINGGDMLTVNGSGDVVNAAEGSTVILSAGDSGDTINMIGGTVVVASTQVTNIIINGTGDVITGPGASLAGAIEVYWPKPIVQSGGNIYQPPAVTITPAIIYNAGDIADLVTYFEANPNLSGNQITAAESDSNYTLSLDNYLTSVPLYQEPNAIPANVIAMLEGNSSIDLAVLGVPASDVAEAAYMEQQFTWVEQTYPDYFQTDGLQSALQNIMAAIESTNTTAVNMVSLASWLLMQGQAAYAANPSDNQGPLLDDTGAKLALEAAEGGAAATGNEQEEINVGRNDPWKIVITPSAPFGNGSSYVFKYETGTFLSQFLNFIEAYIEPVVDAAAFVTGNFELELAAAALDGVQAGQDFASGADLQGAFSALDAIGGAMYAVGQYTNVPGANTLDELEKIGGDLTNGVAVAQGVDGVVNSAEEGNGFNAIISALGGISGMANLGGDTPLAQFASVGASLGAAAQDLGTGNIVAGLASLVDAAQASGVTNVEQDVGVMYDAFTTNLYDPVADAASWLWQATSSELNSLEDFFENFVGQSGTLSNSLVDLSAAQQLYSSTFSSTSPPTQAQLYTMQIVDGMIADEDTIVDSGLQYADDGQIATDASDGPSAGWAVQNPSNLSITYYQETQSADTALYENVGGDIPWRANNPGDISFTQTSVKLGAIGYVTSKTGTKIAVFPDVQTGVAAMNSILKGPSYDGLTIDEAIAQYAPAKDGNNTIGYQSYIDNSLALPGTTALSSLSPTQYQQFVSGIEYNEGYSPSKFGTTVSY